MSFVVTGTPRSGTRYTSRLMTAMGIPCHHEKTLRPLETALNVTRWPTLGIGESSWMGWSLIPLMIGHRVPVLHSIRNPWDVIDSLTNRNHILNPLVVNESALQSVRETINVLLPDVFKCEQRVDRAATLVIEWNCLIVRHVPRRYVFYVDRLDVPIVREMLTYVGESADDAKIESALDEVSTSTNSGYTVDAVPGVSDPDVAKWIVQYAKDNDVGRVATCKIRDVAARQTPEELIERMDSKLVDQVNVYAEHHGYPTYEMVVCV